MNFISIKKAALMQSGHGLTSQTNLGGERVLALRRPRAAPDVRLGGGDPEQHGDDEADGVVGGVDGKAAPALVTASPRRRQAPRST